MTPGGSGYEIVGIEETAMSGREHDPRVFNLVCVKTDPAAIPDDAFVGEMYWMPRGKRR